MSRPMAGQKWNLPQIVAGLSTFETLAGTFAARTGTPETPSMSVHLWKLQAGQPDVQRPHAEEEFYYVLSGRRTLVLSRGTGNERSVDVEAGDLIYVPAQIEHTFEGSTEIVLLVIFAPNFSGPT
jgi:mannose-6-phosphate isomerase-like protein (cupin superfamily)